MAHITFLFEFLQRETCKCHVWNLQLLIHTLALYVAKDQNPLLEDWDFK